MSQKNVREDNSIQVARAALIELARQQGVLPVTDLTLLRSDFWPDNESVDELINAVRAWRNEPETQRTG